MPVGMQLPQEAARIWTDPARRERIVAMHAEAMPLTEMCDELGLGPVLDRDGLREIVANLSDDEVQAIRARVPRRSRRHPRSRRQLPGRLPGVRQHGGRRPGRRRCRGSQRHRTHRQDRTGLRPRAPPASLYAYAWNW